MFVLEQESLGEGAGLGKGRGPQTRESPPPLRSCHHHILEKVHVLVLFQRGTAEGDINKQEVVNIAAMVTSSLSQFYLTPVWDHLG